MDKKLPKIFANKIQKSNNEKVYYSNKDNSVEHDNEIRGGVQSNKTIKDSRTIYQKISNIFNAPDYVYKADVLITTKDYKQNKTIIGQSKGHLITIDNELIPILDIIDIEKVEK